MENCCFEYSLFVYLIAIEAAGIKILAYHLMHTGLVHSLEALWVNYLVEISIQMFFRHYSIVIPSLTSLF
jgi:hypothetical protein